MNAPAGPATPDRRGGTWSVFVASVALVVASSTLVTEFTGFAVLGWGFAVALGLAFVVIVPLALAVADMSAAHPQAGGIYQFARRIVPGAAGTWSAVGLFLCFFGMFLFSAAAEVVAGAWVLRAMCGVDVPVWVPVLALIAAAVAPNLLGLRRAAVVAAGMLMVMIGIRAFFGLAGFAGLADTGAWQAAHLMPEGGWHWFGERGILAAGLALAFWSFVGIEAVSALAAETRQPARSIPRGMVWGLAAILVTSLVMGLGATGTMPLAAWQEIVAGPAGHGGESPQMAFGGAMFGAAGHLLMGLASLAATLSTLTVALAAVPRVLSAVARDGHLPGGLSPLLARVHAGSGAPVNAVLLVAAVLLGLALAGGTVMTWLQSAAYLWVFRYLVLHGLAIANRLRHPQAQRAVRGPWLVPLAVFGMAGALVVFHFGFAGRHATEAPRACAVVLVACAVTAASRWLARRPGPAASPAPGLIAIEPAGRAGAPAWPAAAVPGATA